MAAVTTAVAAVGSVAVGGASAYSANKSAKASAAFQQEQIDEQKAANKRLAKEYSSQLGKTKGAVADTVAFGDARKEIALDTTKNVIEGQTSQASNTLEDIVEKEETLISGSNMAGSGSIEKKIDRATDRSLDAHGATVVASLSDLQSKNLDISMDVASSVESIESKQDELRAKIAGLNT